jgi:hypothetical protein
VTVVSPGSGLEKVERTTVLLFESLRICHERIPIPRTFNHDPPLLNTTTSCLMEMFEHEAPEDLRIKVERVLDAISQV